MPFLKTLALFLLLALLPSSGQAQMASSSCLTQFQMREAVLRRIYLPAGTMVKIARQHAKGELVNIQICPEGNGYMYYYVVLLEKGGKVNFVQLEPDTGKFITVK
jgi:hypothetical protein